MYPNNISNLTLWWDASDPSTINDGKVVGNQNVYKIVDKINGVGLTNASGTLGPTYAIGAVNGNNVIHMPYYPDNSSGLKTLSNSSVSQLSSSNKTIVFVHKPTTAIYQSGPGVTNKYALSIWNSGRNPPNFPSIRLTSSYLSNPYSGYTECAFDTGGGINTSTLQSSNTKSYEYGILTGQQIDLGSTQIVIIRTKSGDNLAKFNFYQQRGFDIKSGYYSYTVNPGLSATFSNPKIVIGSVWETGTRVGNAHPLEGYFCEMMYFNRYLKTSEVNGLEQYLKMKWIG